MKKYYYPSEVRAKSFKKSMFNEGKPVQKNVVLTDLTKNGIFLLTGGGGEGGKQIRFFSFFLSPFKLGARLNAGREHTLPPMKFQGLLNLIRKKLLKIL